MRSSAARSGALPLTVTTGPFRGVWLVAPPALVRAVFWKNPREIANLG